MAHASPLPNVEPSIIKLRCAVKPGGLLCARLVMLPYAQMLPTASLATDRSGLLAGQRQIGFNLNRIGEFEDQQLGNLHAVVGEGGSELGPDPEIVSGEAEALLRFELLRCELHVGDASVRRDVDGLATDGQGAADLCRYLFARLEFRTRLDTLEFEGRV